MFNEQSLPISDIRQRGPYSLPEKQARRELKKTERQIDQANRLFLKYEIEKTPELEATINTCQDWLRTYITDLGVGVPEAIRPERIHFIRNEDEIDARITGNDIAGFTENMTGDIYIPIPGGYGASDIVKERQFMEQNAWEQAFEQAEQDVSRVDRFSADEMVKWAEELNWHEGDFWERYARAEAKNEDIREFSKKTQQIILAIRERAKQVHATKLAEEYTKEFLYQGEAAARTLVLHEMLHLLGFKRTSINKEEYVIRTGYDLPAGKFSKPGESKAAGQAYFVSLNEAAVDSMAFEIDKKNEKRAPNLDGIGYKTDRALLAKIIRMVASANNKSADVTWTRWKKAYFTGELMHLRDIERACGQGALRFYATLKPLQGLKKYEVKNKVRKGLKKYFDFDINDFLEDEDDWEDTKSL